MSDTNKTSRKLSEPLPPKQWIVRISAIDSPAAGEAYLTADEMCDSVIERDIRAGVTISHYKAIEAEAPTKGN